MSMNAANSGAVGRWRDHLAGLGAADGEMLRAMRHEQLALVWLHARIGMVVATSFAVLMAWYLRDTVALPLIAGWMAAKLGIVAVRMAQGTLFARRVGPVGPHWHLASFALLALDGLIWGLGGAWLMAHSVQLASLVAAILACVTCVATFGLQASVRATVAYVVPILLPALLALLRRDDDVGWVGGIGLAMLLGLQLMTARRSQARLDQGVRLRLQAQQLAAEREDALLQARRQAAVKTQFLANISHELRTPLHGILGLARLLHARTTVPADAQRLALIESSGTHLLRLINDLMDASRIETGHFELHADRFELHEQVRQVADLHAIRAADKGLSFRCDVDAPRPCWLFGDPVRLRQVMHNLLGNAIKFTERGQVRLGVRRKAGDDGLQIEVADTGPGMAPADVAHAFEAFRQAGATVGRPREGTGLGLTISREIARAMGGDLRIDSRLGEGTTLLFQAQVPDAPAATIGPEVRPRVGSDVAGAAEPDRPEPATTTATAAGTTSTTAPDAADGSPRRVRVLLAEDDELNAMIAGAYLEHLGVQVERALDGREAAERAVQGPRRPDLVLMDCRMPVMDGYESARQIRDQERARGLGRLPIVALTATVTDDDRRRCLQAGMDDFLSKPFESDELAAVIARWTQPQPLLPR